ncbi:MAG: polyprenyl synthetase family protein [Methanomicrobiales archaeon]|nr:polyprenyl synthetase family protein [Methanomicrobiales archaeon]
MRFPDPDPIIRKELDQVEQELHAISGEAALPLRQMLPYDLGGGGRIRPVLVLLTGGMLGGEERALIEIATAVEMIHAGTLIHDDIIDGVPMRRGRESLHIRWDVSASVLAGDFLLSRALQKVADLRNPDLLSEITSAVCELCDGEIRECSGDGTCRMSREEYFEIVNRKTASLFAAGMTMAGIASGADAGDLKSLEECGRLLGTAFQLMDDLMDITGDGGSTGKSPGNDLRRGVITLPVIVYAESEGGGDILRTIARVTTDDRVVEALKKQIISSGAIVRTQEVADELIRECRRRLDRFPANRYCEAIDRIAWGIRWR